MTPVAVSHPLVVGFVTIALTTLTAPIVSAQTCPGGWVDLEGRVLDESSGLALPGAGVVARWQGEGGDEERAADTDAEGRYLFECLPPTTVTLVARVAQFPSSPVQVSPAETTRPIDLVIDLLQESGELGRLLGRVIDRQTGRPIAGVGLHARPATAATEDASSRQQMTNADGAFVIEDLDPGEYDVSIRHIGYARLDQVVAVPEGRTVELQVELSVDPIELEPLFVTTTRSHKLEVQGFYDRRRWGERLGLGDFITREDIERRNPLRISHMVGGLAGVDLICRGHATRGCHIRMLRTPLNSCRVAAVYVDGIKVVDPERPAETVDQVIRPWEIGAIEVYRSASELPAEFTGASAQCGAVVIWSRGGG